MPRSVLNAVLCVIGALLMPCDLDAQGWGRISKDSVRLKRNVPAQASLQGRRVKLESQVTGNTPQSLLGVIETRFVTELQKESGFILEPNKPETIIRFTITNFYMKSDSTRKTADRNSYTETVTTGALDVSFQALDAENGVAWFSENLSAPYKRVSCDTGSGSSSSGSSKLDNIAGTIGGLFGGCSIPKTNSPPVSNENELMILLVNDVVKQMAKSVTQTIAEIEAPLPGGSLKELGELAKRGEFGAMGEKLQSVKSFAKTEDDAFRYYMLGLAKEARAYTSGDAESTYDLLTKAVLDYEKAVSMRGGDQRLRDAEMRVRQAIRQYDAIEKQKKDFTLAIQRKTEEQQRAAAEKKNLAAQSQQRAVTVKPGTNEEIIEALKAGLDENTILTGLIESNQDPHYDVTTLAGLKQLKDASVPSKIIGAMQARMKARVRAQQDVAPVRETEPAKPKRRTPSAAATPAVGKPATPPVKSAIAPVK